MTIFLGWRPSMAVPCLRLRECPGKDFPRDPSSPEPTMTASIQSAPRRILSAIKVLIVDDSPHMQAILKRVLVDMNIRDLVMAPDIETGLTQLRRIHPDLIFVDWTVKPDGGNRFVRAV